MGQELGHQKTIFGLSEMIKKLFEVLVKFSDHSITRSASVASLRIKKKTIILFEYNFKCRC